VVGSLNLSGRTEFQKQIGDVDVNHSALCDRLQIERTKRIVLIAGLESRF
jgi:hypothetical protein